MNIIIKLDHEVQMMNELDFGRTLRRLREKENMSQKQLAVRIGVSPTSISWYELHQRLPKQETLAKIASVFHVSTDYLIGIEKNRTLDLSGLTDEEIEIIECLVKSMREKNKKIEKY